MRGKGYGIISSWNFTGITPACAGKRDRPGCQNDRCRDHPRVCGEKCFGIHNTGIFLGSPPRVRGKVWPVLIIAVALGITPACAGKRLLYPRSGSWHRDHPRMCGEKFSFLLHTVVLMGSPPHVRGKVQDCHRAAVILGITPACAGKSIKST